jgi:hypothetical protein
MKPGLPARVLVVLFAAAALPFGHASTSAAQAAELKECSHPVFTARGGDLRMQVDRRSITFSGQGNRSDSETLRTELLRIVDKRGEIDGRTVCISLGPSRRTANYVRDSIPAIIGVLRELSGNATFRAMWGGGGLTVVGWMHRNDLLRIKSLSSGVFPVDTAAVGIVEELPGKVRVHVERISISSSRVAQIEQFHPKAGVITLSTTSKVLLQACPGGWRGKTPSSAWKDATCVEFDASTPAILTDPGNDYTHLSVVVRPVRGTVNAIDLELRYTAVDPSFQCYVGGQENLCTLFPSR